MAGATGLRFNFSRQEVEVPLFERMSNNDDFIELQQCQAKLEQFQKRISSLEKINTDLEKRLEEQAKQSMTVETECLMIDRKWRLHSNDLENQISNSKLLIESEKNKGEKLREQLSRTERELYGILQRKYELMRGQGRNSAQNKYQSNLVDSSIKRNDISSTENDSETMIKQPKESRKAKERKIMADLSDFLGF
eukprot:gene4809-6738_t